MSNGLQQIRFKLDRKYKQLVITNTRKVARRRRRKVFIEGI
jgi:hypothetical protein